MSCSIVAGGDHKSEIKIVERVIFIYCIQFLEQMTDKRLPKAAGEERLGGGGRSFGGSKGLPTFERALRNVCKLALRVPVCLFVTVFARVCVGCVSASVCMKIKFSTSKAKRTVGTGGGTGSGNGSHRPQCLSEDPPQKPN